MANSSGNDGGKPLTRGGGRRPPASGCNAERWPRVKGKTGHYPGAPGLRWLSTTGEKGPWSETASATIGA